jgi:hypothetical protein
LGSLGVQGEKRRGRICKSIIIDRNKWGYQQLTDRLGCLCKKSFASKIVSLGQGEKRRARICESIAINRNKWAYQQLTARLGCLCKKILYIKNSFLGLTNSIQAEKSRAHI